MMQDEKTPAAWECNAGAHETTDRSQHILNSELRYRAQVLAFRYALPLETAAMIAPSLWEAVMAEICLPDHPQRRALKAVFVDTHEVAGHPLYSVVAWIGAARLPKRKWFADRGLALAHAAEVADLDGLTLFDLSGGE